VWCVCYVYVCTCMCVRVCVHACVYICAYIVCMCVCVYVYACICVHMCLYVCARVCVYVFVFSHGNERTTYSVVLVFFSYLCVDSGNLTQNTRLAWEAPYPLNHLSGPQDSIHSTSHQENTKMHWELGSTSRSVSCLLQGPEVNIQHPHKNPGTVACVCNPGLVKGRGSQGLLGTQSSNSSQAPDH